MQQVDAVLAVDWHAVLAWRRLQQQAPAWAHKPWVFLNYRIFSRDKNASKVIQDTEKWAFEAAHASVVLNQADARWVREVLKATAAAEPAVLPPGIRQDAASVGPPADLSGRYGSFHFARIGLEEFHWHASLSCVRDTCHLQPRRTCARMFDAVPVFAQTTELLSSNISRCEFVAGQL